MRRIGLAVTAVLLVGACGGSAGDAAPSIAPDCADLGERASFAIELVDYAFHPGCAIVSAEQPFELTNTGEAVHTFTIDEQQVDIEVGPGDTYRSDDGLNVEPGTYLLRCILHEQMIGTIEVR